MATRNLVLPQHAEPEPRMMVATRLVGPMLAALRRQGGYRFVVETDRHGETAAWLVKAALRIV
jgi:hypothetical protein